MTDARKADSARDSLRRDGGWSFRLEEVEAERDRYKAALEEIERRAKREYDNYEEHGGIIAMYEPLSWVRDLVRRALNGSDTNEIDPRTHAQRYWDEHERWWGDHCGFGWHEPDCKGHYG